MIKALLQECSARVGRLIEDLKGFEETGTIPMDCVSYNIRDRLTDLGVI